MQDENKWEDETRTEKNGETRCKPKKMERQKKIGRRDARRKKMGRQDQDKK